MVTEYSRDHGAYLQFEDNQDVGFRRSASRVGVNFGVGEIPTYRGEKDASCLSISKDKLETVRLDCMIHSALQATSDDIDLYLKKVAAMQLVMPGSIVYAPRNPIERQNTSCGIVTKLQVSSNRDMTVPELFKDIGKITVNECSALNAEILVSVYDGNQSWSIPINYCSLYGGLAGEDRALEILRSKNHNIDDAFSEIFGLYNRRMEEPDEYLWSKEQFDAFMSAVMTCKKENLWRVYVNYKKNMRRVILKTQRPDKSFKSIFDLYERMFPDIDVKDSFQGEEGFLSTMNRYRCVHIGVINTIRKTELSLSTFVHEPIIHPSCMNLSFILRA